MPKQADGSLPPEITVRQAPATLAIAGVAAYVVLQVAGRFVRLPVGTPLPLVLTVVVLTWSAFMVATVLMVSALARRWLAPRSALIALAFGIGGWLSLIGIAAMLGPAAAKLPRTIGLAFGLGSDLTLTVAKVGLGVLVAGLIREPNILLPAGAFAAFADYFMVRYGTVHVALSTERGQKLFDAVSSKTPAIQATGYQIPVLGIGPADIVFIAFFVACALRLEMASRATIVAFCIVLPIALVSALFTNIPALLPMSVAFIIVNWRAFRLSPEERKSVAIAAGVVALATAGFFLIRALR